MQTLSQEIREVICRRVQSGSPEELMTIVGVLTGDRGDRIEAVVETRLAQPGHADASPTAERFSYARLNDDEVVYDNTTGLMWSRSELSQERVTWAEAEKTCRELRLAGFTDWRLPTVDELFALADRTKHEPAIDKSAFPECKSAWYWTATPYAPSPADCAWLVNFGYGYADWSSRSLSGFVRAVRASQ